MRSILDANLQTYRAMTPSLARVEKVLGMDPARYTPDHVAYRTFKMAGGIDIFSTLLTRQGYTRMDNYSFPTRKLVATWFKPPVGPNEKDTMGPSEKDPIGPTVGLPRIFVSQVQDDQLSPESQRIIYANINNAHYTVSTQPYLPHDDETVPPSVTVDEFSQLQQESEYAAWTLVHGNRINHLAILQYNLNAERGEDALSLDFLAGLEARGFPVLGGPLRKKSDNPSQKGVIHVSRDGLLLQASLVADPFTVPLRVTRGDDDTMVKNVTLGGGFVEFIQRGRDGFEPENALEIFESTSIKNRQ